MKFELNDYVQRDLNFAIVDEVDSILIDEARTPLIISGPTEDSTDKYYKINRIIPSLKKDDDYTIEEKTKTAALTEEGNIKVEKMLGAGNLYDPSNVDLVHHVHQALKAHALFHRDVDYVVKDGEVMIVDEFTGRLMPGRRWSDGLHQAIEAKEGVKIENENQTLASITFQNYFRLYAKLAGMTGTAETEAAEFAKIYNLDVVVIPTHRPMVRTDNADFIYKNEKAKFNAAIAEIEEKHKKGQPVLVGTISIDKSETAVVAAQEKGHPAFRPERQIPRDGGRDRGAGRPLPGRYHRHEHGRPRNGHRAGRQSRRAHAPDAQGQGVFEGRVGQDTGRIQEAMRRGKGKGHRGRRPSYPRHRTARGAAHRQPAPRTFGQAGRSRAPRGSTSRSRTICSGSSVPTGSRA